MTARAQARRGAKRKQMPQTETAPLARSFTAPNLLTALRRLGMGGLVAGLAVASISAWPVVRDWASVPMSEIQFSGYSGGEFSGYSDYGASEEELLGLALPLMGESYWELDVEKIKRAVETHPWVREATVSKRWPEKVIVGVDEFMPVARWNDNQLLSMRGHLFAVENIEAFSHLPHFSVPWRAVPSRDTIQLLADRYNDYQRQLAKAGLEITEMNYITPHNVALTVNTGLNLFLGTSDHQQRLQRFVNFVGRLQPGQLQELATVDMRYPDGIAVSSHAARSENVEGYELAGRPLDNADAAVTGDSHG